MIQKRVFFEFATHWLARHKGQTFTAASWEPKAFKLTDAEWRELRGIMENRKVALTDSIWAADREFITRQLRSEFASATVGQTERYKILVEDDAQLNEALELFPRAAKLMAGSMETVHAKRSARP
jgi:hypothetical protein